MSRLADINARLRDAHARLAAGESLDAVAAATGVPVLTLKRVSEISAFDLLRRLNPR